MRPGESTAHVSVYLQRWRLASPELIADTPTSRVYQVFHRGRWAVLKLLKSAHAEDERRGCAMLAWYAGSGAAIVYEMDDEAVLMEWADGAPLSRLVADGKDDLATEIICQTIALLHAPRPGPPPELLPLEARYATLFSVSTKLWPMAGRDMLIRARFIAGELLASMPEAVPLHGDIHHDNIYFSGRSWIAIDPRGLLGDPAYDFASSFLNPRTMSELCIEPARIERMAGAFAARFGLPLSRIFGFAATHAALSICWDLAEDQPASHQFSILSNLLAAYGRVANDRA